MDRARDGTQKWKKKKKKKKNETNSKKSTIKYGSCINQTKLKIAMRRGFLFWSHLYVRKHVIGAIATTTTTITKTAMNRTHSKRKSKRKILKNRDKHKTAHIVDISDWFRMQRTQHPSLRSLPDRSMVYVYLNGLMKSFCRHAAFLKMRDECRPVITWARASSLVRAFLCGLFAFAGFKRHLILRSIILFSRSIFCSHPINQTIKIQ